MVTRSQLDIKRIDSAYAEYKIVVVVIERKSQPCRRVRRSIESVLDLFGIRFIEERNDIL